jgi:hypothetical protein
MPDPVVAVRAGAEAVLLRVKDDGKLDKQVRRVKIHHNDPALGPRDPNKAKEVAWIASGLPRGQSIRIDRKGGTPAGYMRYETYSILAVNTPLYSEMTRKGPRPARSVTWSYDVRLLGDQGQELDKIDPDVVIEDDP